MNYWIIPRIAFGFLSSAIASAVCFTTIFFNDESIYLVIPISAFSFVFGVISYKKPKQIESNYVIDANSLKFLKDNGLSYMSHVKHFVSQGKHSHFFVESLVEITFVFNKDKSVVHSIKRLFAPTIDNSSIVRFTEKTMKEGITQLKQIAKDKEDNERH